MKPTNINIMVRSLIISNGLHHHRPFVTISKLVTRDFIASISYVDRQHYVVGDQQILHIIDDEVATKNENIEDYLERICTAMKLRSR